ncbi:hypothetical protein QBC39DRAFT_328647 [Podospora conica]|nr:hypothetical protein QBC39DRAFT_328647 [Schizothecium conicum]
MKPTLLLLGLAALTYATPVLLQDRAQVSAAQVDDAATKLDALTAKVETLSASINETVATMPSSTEAEKDALADAVAPELKELETALAEATALIEGGAQKRADGGLVPRTCSDSCLTGKANGLVVMISGTVSGLVGCLGVGG